VARLGILCFGFAIAPAIAQTLAVVSPVLAQFDGGPSSPAGFGFGSGESIFLSFDVAGFKATAEDDPKVELSWECRTLDGAGVPLLEPKSGSVKVELAPEDKNWRPKIRVELPLPQALMAGPGSIQLRITDQIAKKTVEHTVPFRMRGPNLSGADTLRPLHFRFLRSEDGNDPLTVAAYRPGDTVWAKFEIAGYQIGPNNSFAASYGLEVLRANGESLFKQEEAAREGGESFYPRRYLFGSLSLNLTKDLALGEYTIVLRLLDHLGMRQSETKHSFRVE
jgi:hypothetical protein